MGQTQTDIQKRLRMEKIRADLCNISRESGIYSNSYFYAEGMLCPSCGCRLPVLGVCPLCGWHISGWEPMVPPPFKDIPSRKSGFFAG